MGWFYKEDEAHLAAQAGVKLADKKAVLPLTARSHTPVEFAAVARRRIFLLWSVYIFLAGGTLVGLALDKGNESRIILTYAGPLVLAGAVLIYAGMRWRARRDGVYRDPGISVEVGADGIVLRNGEGAYGQSWLEIVAHVNWSSDRRGLHFHGLWLDGPVGRVDLRDECYRNGRIAAGAIARGMIGAHDEAAREKVERIG